MKNTAQKVNKTSTHLDTDRQAELRKIFPDVFSEDKIDWDRLQAVLGEAVDFGREKFGFTWKGKGAAIKSVLIPSKATLVPAEKESVSFDKTENIFIEGDNLEVLKLLQKTYFEQVKVIYIDPPYNTGNDFVYSDNFAAPLKNYLEQTGQKDSEGNTLQTNRESSGRYHSDWLSMMYPRLKLAWNLLREDGAIFVSIDDNEVNNLRQILNEIFGEENFVAQLVWSGGRKNDSKLISVSHEYILCYLKSASYFQEHQITWRQRKKGIDDIYKAYESFQKKYKNDFEKIEAELRNWFAGLPNTDPAKAHSHYSNVDERGVYFAADISWPGGGGPKYEVLHPVTKKPCKVPARGWMFGNQEKMKEVIAEGRVHFGPDETYVPCIKAYLSDREEQVPYSVFYQDGRAATKRLRELMGGDYFDHPKDELVLKDIFEFSTGEGDLVMDFFAGSGTTAHSIIALNAEDGKNRKWVCVQLPEKTNEKSEAYNAGYKTIADISKERIRRAAKQIGIGGDLGFKVLKLAPSNYVENNFDFDPEKSEEENTEAFEAYLAKAKQKSLFPNAASEAVVYENIVKEGFSLNSKIEKTKIGKNTFHEVTDGDKHMLICLDAKIEGATVKAFAEDGFKDKTVIVLDDALSDTDKANLALNVELKTM
jgi:adenine-specific DNA-methyltransferase